MDRTTASVFVAVAVLWGIPYALIAVALDHGAEPLLIAWARVAIGAAVLIVIAAARGELAALRPYAVVLVLVAICDVAAPFTALSYGEQHVSSSRGDPRRGDAAVRRPTRRRVRLGRAAGPAWLARAGARVRRRGRAVRLRRQRQRGLRPARAARGVRLRRGDAAHPRPAGRGPAARRERGLAGHRGDPADPRRGRVPADRRGPVRARGDRGAGRAVHRRRVRALLPPDRARGRDARRADDRTWRRCSRWRPGRSRSRSRSRPPRSSGWR